MQSLQAGSLDRRIAILVPQDDDDGLQTLPGAPVEFMSCWASATPVLDGERFRADQTQASITMRFVIRWSSKASQIDPTMLVKFGGRTFGIAATKEIGRRVGVEISATARAETPA
ncbi:MAG TPA: phage head closure protein [Caulobacteraceae bacterium]|jgi:SPP1 family predicted phage head-tail adaptor|nr:phage head closure protein [Caulobacteraceae bacterium]